MKTIPKMTNAVLGIVFEVYFLIPKIANVILGIVFSKILSLNLDCLHSTNSR